MIAKDHDEIESFLSDPGIWMQQKWQQLVQKVM
jgi:hypothetical protein